MITLQFFGKSSDGIIWLISSNSFSFLGNSAFRFTEQRVAALHNHSSQKTVNFSNTIRFSGMRDVILHSLGNRKVCKSQCFR